MPPVPASSGSAVPAPSSYSGARAADVVNAPHHLTARDVRVPPSEATEDPPLWGWVSQRFQANGFPPPPPQDAGKGLLLTAQGMAFNRHSISIL